MSDEQDEAGAADEGTRPNGETGADERTRVDEGTRAALRELHAHLAATAERPVERTQSAYLGEAEAVAADLARDPDVPRSVVRDRVGTVVDLLSNVEATGDDAADERVDAARRLAEEILR